MSEDFSPARGTRDILPAEAALRDAVTDTFLKIYRLHGFDRIETPAIEALSRLEKSEGGDNTKLIYKILKRGEKLDEAQGAPGEALADLGLRFDLTVPLARYYANNRGQLPATFKAIQVGPVWRAERPQKGRYRQFVQCDIDVLGSALPLVEAELLVAGGEALAAVGLDGFAMRLNDRRILAAIARDCGIPDDRFGEFCITVDKADKIGMDGVIRELGERDLPGNCVALVERFFTRLPEIGADDIKKLPGIFSDAANVPQDALERLAVIKDCVARQLGGKGTVGYDYTLVRGMGYYTGTIFEVGYGEYSYSIAGGGRYDGMVKAQNGSGVPACGLSIGFERVITILQDQNSQLGQSARRVAILTGDATPVDKAIEVQQSFIRDDIPAAIFPRARNMNFQLEQLGKAGFGRFVIVDDSGKPGETRPISG
jgi:histidyl-tRNA synthetase